MQGSRKCQHEIYECVILVAVKTVVHASGSDESAECAFCRLRHLYMNG